MGFWGETEGDLLALVDLGLGAGDLPALLTNFKVFI